MKRWQKFALCLLLAVTTAAVNALAFTISPPIGAITINGHTYTNSDWEANPQGTLVAVINDFVLVLTSPTPGLGHTPNLAGLKAISVGSVSPGSRMMRDGYTASGDGGGAAYTFSGSACSAADNGAQVAPNAGTGCWLLDPAQVNDARIWGAKGDNTANDTAALQAAITATGTAGSVLEIPKGTYKTTAALTVSIYKSRIKTRGIATIAPSGTFSPAILWTGAASFTEIDDLSIDGTINSATVSACVQYNPSSGNNWNMLRRISLTGCSDGVLLNGTYPAGDTLTIEKMFSLNVPRAINFANNGLNSTIIDPYIYNGRVVFNKAVGGQQPEGVQIIGGTILSLDNGPGLDIKAGLENHIIGTIVDQSRIGCISLDATTNQISNTRFDSVWCGTAAGIGANVDGVKLIPGASFVPDETMFNGLSTWGWTGNGMSIGGGAGVVTNVHISKLSSRLNTTADITLTNPARVRLSDSNLTSSVSLVQTGANNDLLCSGNYLLGSVTLASTTIQGCPSLGQSSVSQQARVFRNANQTVSASPTTVLFDTAEFNVGGSYSTINGQYQPSSRGLYKLSACVTLQADSTAGDVVGATIEKNGTTAIASSFFTKPTVTAGITTVCLSGDEQMNGSTDFVRVNIVLPGSNRFVLGGSDRRTVFSAKVIP